jgi:hypothetical protein
MKWMPTAKGRAYHPASLLVCLVSPQAPSLGTGGDGKLECPRPQASPASRLRPEQNPSQPSFRVLASEQTQQPCPGLSQNHSWCPCSLPAPTCHLPSPLWHKQGFIISSPPCPLSAVNGAPHNTLINNCHSSPSARLAHSLTAGSPSCIMEELCGP